MASFYKFGRLPKVWPGRQRAPTFAPKRSPFKAKTWSQVEKELERELKHLQAKHVELALDVDMTALRQDGGLYADTRPRSSKVLVSFVDGRDGVKRQFPCDSFAYWQDNVWAIVKTLEMLRAIDRYGVTQGDQQYVGFAALPPGKDERRAMTPEEAAEIISRESLLPAVAILDYPEVATVALQRAKSHVHPDAGGETAAFQQVMEAQTVLNQHHDEDLS